MTIRKILAVLLALSVAFAPAVAIAADAPVAAHHAGQSIDAGHCAASHGGKPAKPSHDPAGKNCCMAMCIAVAIAPASAGDGGLSHKLSATVPVQASLLDHPAEIATPPPRAA